MEKDKILVEVQTQFLYPNMVLQGNAFDEQGTLVLKANVPVQQKDIDDLKKKGIKVLKYERKKINFKNGLSDGMIQEQSLEKAYGVVDRIKMSIQGGQNNIPDKEVKEVVNGIMSDIKNNEDAYLNLLELIHNDEYTYTHSINVSGIAILLGNTLKYDESRLQFLGSAGMLLDLGMIQIPPEITAKPDKLTDQEWSIVKNHSVYGYNLIKAESAFDKNVEQAVLMHHENHNGKGYPLGLAHEKLNPLSQVLAIADVFDALTTDRPHKPAWSLSKTFSYIMEQSGLKFSPHITQVFLGEMTKKISKIPLYPEKSYVLLSTGEVAVVVGHRKDLYTLRPIIEIFFNPKKGKTLADKFFKHPIQIDLEMDSRRYIVKKIISPDYLQKFDNFLGIERTPKDNRDIFTSPVLS